MLTPFPSGGTEAAWDGCPDRREQSLWVLPAVYRNVVVAGIVWKGISGIEMESTSSALPFDHPLFDEEVTRYLQLGLLMCISSFRSLVYLDTKIEKPLGIYVL